MYQSIVCDVQDKCKWYLNKFVCDVCKRNKNERVDNFEESKAKTITVASSDKTTWTV